MSVIRGVTLPSAFDDLDVGITLHDPESGAILDVNERLERLYGYPAAELREMSVGEYTAPSTKYTEAEATRRIRAAAAGERQSFEWQVERATGELRWVRVRLSPTTIDGEECVLAEIDDITEYRTRERRLRLLSRIVRHNLRNRMNLVRGRAAHLGQAVDDEALSAEAESIARVADEVGGLSDSVTQIEEMAEPDATEREPTNVRAVVGPVVQGARESYPDAALSLVVDENAWLMADEGLRYALEHAVENAIEHNDRESPTVEVTVSADDDGQCVIRVADDGPPIPDVETDVLDGTVAASSTYHGTGVGLWVMQWCVNSLGGELSFGENHPRGNVVTISLPRVDESDASR
ncbi:PAS domain-containing sensor histidine kinase [Halosimplex pelagicum]|uniref:histidine kinase n=1 Tax=Halosimplex pelagicum TaxID=869886 RepID=A0A7D5TX48_9EURY|nr:PAS domain-containing sensor histidine kinase [Halosimplex pelagicum]QLH84514.1 PAS domain-containing sensor histidine kinase [Halosimplex pelagicum]